MRPALPLARRAPGRFDRSLPLVDTTTVALIASGIGAAGAIAGQVVAAAFTGRRESRRLTWEKERAAEDREHERRKQFMDTKRAAYARFVQLALGRHDQLIALWAETHRRTEKFAKVEEESDGWWREVTEVLAEISLLNPSIEQLCRSVYGRIAEWEYAVIEEGAVDDTSSFADGFEGPLEAAQRGMRQDLGIEAVAADRLERIER